MAYYFTVRRFTFCHCGLSYRPVYMGAGVAKFPPEDHSEQSSMSVCENCSTRFTPFKRKKPCHECGRNFCSSCAEKIPENTSHRRCGRCSRLVNGNFSRKDLESYKARELHQFLTKRKVPVQNCREKNDLIDVVMKFSNNDHYRAEQREHQAHLQSLQRLRENLASPEGADTSGGTNPDHSREIPRPPDYTTLYHPATTTTTTQNTEGTSQHSTQSPSTEQQSHDQQSADPSHAMSVPSQPETSEPPGDNDAQSAGNTGSQPTEGAEQSPKADQRPSFMKLCDVKTLESIKDLTTRQLKEILSGNFVDYKGCVEKAELIQRVERLYIENENNKKTASQIEESAHTGEVELCKICMDRLVDCVLLECGHMLTCTQCGRQLAECPICRQYVVRVVHVFKS